MGILQLTTQLPAQVGIVPRTVKMLTTDSLATITTAGYLNPQNLEGNSIAPTDVLEVIYAYSQQTGAGTFDVFLPTISNGVITLTQDVSSGNVLLPVNSGDIAIFNGTSGQIATSGFNIASGLLAEPALDALTAHAGGGQTSALALTKEVNRITTVTTAADSVKLPVSVAGMSIIIINSGANSMQVFGAGTDTINNVATATGVAQMANSSVLYVSSVAGKWFSIGLGLGVVASLPTASYSNALTAHAGGTQAAALLLPSAINNVTTVASAADSVKLPASAAGLNIIVVNSAATNAMQVYGSGTDTINGVATATGVSQAAGTVVTYVCTAAGSWFSNPQSFGTAAAKTASDNTKTIVASVSAATTSGNVAQFNDVTGTVGNGPVAANVLLTSAIVTPDVSIDLVKFDVTVGQAALATAGHVALVTSSGSKQYKIRSLWINSGGTNFSGGGGDRLGQVTDGTTVYSVVPATNMQTLVNAGWGMSTPLPFPAAAAINTSTVAGANLYFAYSGGTTDYTAGSIVVSGLAERVA